MPLHGFHSAYENQRFQPGSSQDMVQFFDHEAWIEDDAVAAELDKMIAKGAVPHIRRIEASTIEAEAEKAEANLTALRAKALAAKNAAIANSNAGASVGITTTSNLGAIAADSLSNVSTSATAATKK